MDSLNFIIPFVVIGVAGALVLFIVAVIQESKADRRGGFRHSFFTIVSLIMLTLVVGSSIALLNIGFRQFVFRSANLYNQRYNSPPPLYLPGQGTIVPLKGEVAPASVAPVPVPSNPTVYTCAKDCQFSADDKTAVEQWVTTYTDWQKQQSLSLATRRSLANALGFFIVSLPLFFIFSRLMEKGRQGEQTTQPSPIRSLYFYGIAFAGLVMAVVASGVIVNDGLKVWLKTGGDSNVISRPVATDVITNDAGVKSLLACQSKCGFTSEQIALARQWQTENAQYLDVQKTNRGQYSMELSAAIPFVLIGLPLFFYHFSIGRKESNEPKPTSPAIS